MTLRPLTYDDVDTLVELDRDPEVMRYITGGKPTPREQVIETVRRRMGRRWMGTDRVTAEFVGWFGLVPSATTEAEYEVGYRLRRAAWGKGRTPPSSSRSAPTTSRRWRSDSPATTSRAG